MHWLYLISKLSDLFLHIYNILILNQTRHSQVWFCWPPVLSLNTTLQNSTGKLGLLYCTNDVIHWMPSYTGNILQIEYKDKHSKRQTIWSSRKWKTLSFGCRYDNILFSLNHFVAVSILKNFNLLHIGEMIYPPSYLLPGTSCTQHLVSLLLT